MTKKITKWSKGLEKGLGYMLDLIEEEQQKNETKKQTSERHNRMTVNSKKFLAIWKQCNNCEHFDLNTKLLCIFHEKLDYPCSDFIPKHGGKAE